MILKTNLSGKKSKTFNVARQHVTTQARVFPTEKLLLCIGIFSIPHVNTHTP